MDPFIGEIRQFAFGMIPRGWRLCDGSALSISQNQALYALLGTRDGGDGRNNFNLPDLRGRVPLTQGVGPDGTTYALGTSGGSEGVVLSAAHIPTHSHSISCSSQAGSSNQPQSNQLAAAPAGKLAYAEPQAPMTPMATNTLASSGTSTAHNNVQPSLTINFCIAVTGLFPPRA